MRIAVIGAGKIGGTIGGIWEKSGHEVVYGLRDPSKHQGAQPIDGALEGAEAVLLAVPGNAVVELVRQHAPALDGKLVIDATNNFGGPAMNSMPALTAALPKAHLYRALNTLGWDVFANPMLGGEQADLFYCGPEGPSQEQAERLFADVGLRPIRVGDADAADVVDGILRLWFTLSRRLGRRIAFQTISDQPIS